MNNEDLKNMRLDHSVILDWVTEGSSVLELGCGSGDLLSLLVKYRKAEVSGIEINDEAIFTCVSRGLGVSHQDINDGLSEYADRAFDYVVINQSLQEVRRPHIALAESVRVGKRAIIGFSNFANYDARFQLAFRGIAPVTPALPFQWYDTPNLHFLSIKDFINYCRKNSLDIEKQTFLNNRGKVNFWPNLLAGTGLFQIKAVN